MFFSCDLSNVYTTKFYKKLNYGVYRKINCLCVVVVVKWPMCDQLIKYIVYGMTTYEFNKS